MATIRKVGSLTLGAPGTGTVLWQMSDRPAEACHIQVQEAGAGGNSFTHLVRGSLEPSRSDEVLLSATITNDGIHNNILQMPYMKVSVTASVIGSGVFDVYVYG